MISLKRSAPSDESEEIIMDDLSAKATSIPAKSCKWLLVIILVGFVLLAIINIATLVSVWHSTKRGDNKKDISPLDSSTQSPDVCASEPCLNNGTCVITPSSYSCLCPEDFQGIRCEAAFRDCYEIHRAGYEESRIYRVYVGSDKTLIDVYCDMETRGGGWTVLMRRKFGDTDFHVGWDSYKAGFGALDRDFWLGNEMFHKISMYNGYGYELGVTIIDMNDYRYFAMYTKFNVRGEDENYQLLVGNYHGNAGDGLTGHNNLSFSTIDRDNDQRLSPSALSCATFGGWWYHKCYNSKLTATFYKYRQVIKKWSGIYWPIDSPLKSYSKSFIKYADMKIRPWV